MLIGRAGFVPPAITERHGWAAGSLPPLQSDPFDRILVAQTMAEGLTIVTSDRRMRDYGVRILAA